MIIITGMHRSGTSFTANMLYELDLNFGEPSLLMEADQWNPRGYYENTEIHILNDRILLGDLAPVRKFRTTLPRQRSLALRVIMTAFRSQYSLLSGRSQIETRAAQKQEEIRRLAKIYANVAVKDPRFSLTIGSWAKYTSVDKILYCYRHPYEVAMSVQKHYHLPLWIGYRLWHRHVEEFFVQARGLPIIMIHYGGFFDDNPLDEVQRLYRFAGKPYVEQDAQAMLDRVLDRALKRNIYRGHSLPHYVAAEYERLNYGHATYCDLKPFEPEARQVAFAQNLSER